MAAAQAAQAQGLTPYFGAVDGLRAVAVASVLAYHLNALLPGGFVGVDIFFVISGFVVTHSTSQLPWSSAKAFILGFYARRMLRIVPALAVCVVVSAGVSALVVPDAWLSDNNLKTGLAALFGLSNYALAATSNGYWAPRSEFNPFTQTWSLGVEEQFYLLGPLLLLAWRRPSARLPVLFTVIALAVVSLGATAAAAAGAKGGDQTLAFYSVHTRLWELAVGVMLAMTQQAWRPQVARLKAGPAQALAGAALATLAGALCLANPHAFPWPWALAPVFGTALLLVCVVGRPADGLARALSAPAPAALGRLSYSLYLWHWPVLVVMRWTVGLDTPSLLAAALACSLLLAVASYTCVERPVRRSRFLAQWPRPRVIALGGGCLLLAAGLLGALAVFRGSLSMSVTKDTTDWSWAANLPLPSSQAPCAVAQAKQALAGGLAVSFQPAACEARQGHIFVAGDSHAGAYSALLKTWVRTEGAQVSLFTYPACAVFGLRRPHAAGDPACLAFVQQVLARVHAEARPGDVLFLPSLRIDRLTDQWQAQAQIPNQLPALRDEAVAEAVRMLAPLAERGVVVLFEAPKPVFAVPLFRCSDWFNAMNPICRGARSTPLATLDAMRLPVIASMQAVVQRLPRAGIYDPLPALCNKPGNKPADGPAAGAVCSPSRDGRPLFFDGDHLSGYGNATLMDGFKTAVSRARAGP